MVDAMKRGKSQRIATITERKDRRTFTTLEDNDIVDHQGAAFGPFGLDNEVRQRRGKNEKVSMECLKALLQQYLEEIRQLDVADKDRVMADLVALDRRQHIHIWLRSVPLAFFILL